jgi:hypothetical protein
LLVGDDLLRACLLLGNVSAEGSHFLVPMGAGGVQESHNIVVAGELQLLHLLTFSSLGGKGGYDLPDVLGKCLGSLGCMGQLCLQPFMRGTGVVFSLLVQLLQPVVDSGVIPLDSADPMIVVVELVTAEFIQVLEVTFGLFVLVYKLP